MLAFVFNLILIAAGAGHDDGGFMGFYNKYLNFPGFEVWRFVNLALFVLLISYFVRKPLSGAFKAKRETIRAELIKAEQDKQAALAELTSAEAKLVSLESEKNSVIERAKDEAEAEAARLREQAAEEVRRLREQTGGEIARLMQLSAAELRRFSAEESIRLAEEKLRGRIDAQKDARLIKSNIEAIGGLN